MQSIRALVRPVDLRAFPVHAISNEPRCDVERIAFIRPPAVHAQSKVFAVGVPVAAGFLFIKPREFASVVSRSAKFVREDHRVEHGPEIILMELVEHFLGIGEYARVPCERAVLGIPAGWTESRSQIDQRVAGQLLFAECFRFSEDFLAAGKRAVRLLIAKTPERRHFGVPGQAPIFGHDRCGLARCDEENIKRQRGIRSRRQELAFRPRKVKHAERLVEEHRPPACPDDPGNRYASAVCAELIAALPAAHRVGRSTAVELRAALSEPKQR